MKYADVINPKYAIPPDAHLCKRYIITRSLGGSGCFIHFRPRGLRSYQELDKNWKIHLSIHPKNLAKAWEIITPYLYEKKIPFKIANPKGVQRLKTIRQKKLDRLRHEYKNYLKNQDTFSAIQVKDTFHKLYQSLATYKQSKWRIIAIFQTFLVKVRSFFYQFILNQKDLLKRSQEIYEELITLKKGRVKNSSRLIEGMQFTLYIPPGLEKKYQETLQTIEDNLLIENIFPGTFFSTDRQIGLYSSVRHPGKRIYLSATEVETYNPDNLPDPFDFLKTIPKNEILQESDILGHKNSVEFMVAALRTAKFVPPSVLKTLSVNKEAVVKYIATLSPKLSSELITECLDKSSNLGKFFRVKRGLCKPEAGHGTLKQLEEMTLNTPII